MKPQDRVREALASIPAGSAWPANQEPQSSDVFTPRTHRNVLDLSRALVVGNRGVGKTFWSHVLWSKAGRELASATYHLPGLKSVRATFGFKGTFSDENAPSAELISDVLAAVPDPINLWLAVLLKAHGGPAMIGLPNDFVGLTKWFASNREEGERRLRGADDASKAAPLLLMFDALDTLASDWTEIRHRTESLLRLAMLAKGLPNTKIKIFMRPDQFEDTALFRFPDASKLRAERVNLEWRFDDLYALLFFHLWKDKEVKSALISHIGASPRLFKENGARLEPELVTSLAVQQAIFSRLAGEWMGNDKKRGATYSWLIQHLSDAHGETTPRGFLTALRSATDIPPAKEELVIDHRGIIHGVAEASENRVADLLQDYWWIDYVREPLAGLHTPLDKAALLDVWRKNDVVGSLTRASPSRGLLPIYLVFRSKLDMLPRNVADQIPTDEDALLMSLRLISVCELRPNGKVNFPDIFRVAFKMKRRGGVPPKKGS